MTLTQTKAALERSLLLAGFVDARVMQPVDGVGVAHAYMGNVSTSCFGSTEKPLLKPVVVSHQSFLDELFLLKILNVYSRKCLQSIGDVNQISISNLYPWLCDIHFCTYIANNWHVEAHLRRSCMLILDSGQETNLGFNICICNQKKIFGWYWWAISSYSSMVTFFSLYLS